MSLNNMEIWIEEDQRGKHLGKIWNMFILENGQKSKAMKVKILLYMLTGFLGIRIVMIGEVLSIYYSMCGSTGKNDLSAKRMWD